MRCIFSHTFAGNSHKSAAPLGLRHSCKKSHGRLNAGRACNRSGSAPRLPYSPITPHDLPPHTQQLVQAQPLQFGLSCCDMASSFKTPHDVFI